MLLAAELVLAGMIVEALHPSAFWAGWQSRPAFPAMPQPLFAGISPTVEIDDSDGSVSVVASADGNVHASGSGSSISHIANGVRVTSDSHIEVAVPRGTHLVIEHCDGATITGALSGLDVQSDDGSIVASGLDLRGVNATLHSDSGSVTVSGRFGPGGNYDFSSDDGSITVALASGSDAAIDASTNDGNVEIDGQSASGDDAASLTARAGSGSSEMRVHAQDGSIRITTNGAM
jgi:DUF4097 and DUF4098 domain-containing protein YvlB